MVNAVDDQAQDDNQFEEEITATENNDGEKEKLSPGEAEKLKVMTDAFEIPAENQNEQNDKTDSTVKEDAGGKIKAKKVAKREDKTKKITEVEENKKDGTSHDFYFDSQLTGVLHKLLV